MKKSVNNFQIELFLTVDMFRPIWVSSVRCKKVKNYLENIDQFSEYIVSRKHDTIPSK